jgi:hypothetical protein
VFRIVFADTSFSRRMPVVNKERKLEVSKVRLNSIENDTISSVATCL